MVRISGIETKRNHAGRFRQQPKGLLASALQENSGAHIQVLKEGEARTPLAPSDYTLFWAIYSELARGHALFELLLRMYKNTKMGLHQGLHGEHKGHTGD